MNNSHKMQDVNTLVDKTERETAQPRMNYEKISMETQLKGTCSLGP